MLHQAEVTIQLKKILLFERNSSSFNTNVSLIRMQRIIGIWIRKWFFQQFYVFNAFRIVHWIHRCWLSVHRPLCSRSRSNQTVEIWIPNSTPSGVTFIAFFYFEGIFNFTYWNDRICWIVFLVRRIRQTYFPIVVCNYLSKNRSWPASLLLEIAVRIYWTVWTICSACVVHLQHFELIETFKEFLLWLCKHYPVVVHKLWAVCSCAHQNLPNAYFYNHIANHILCLNHCTQFLVSLLLTSTPHFP